MKKSRFTDSQILAILKQGENGVPVSDLCQEHGVSNATYHNWRSKYGGMRCPAGKLSAAERRCLDNVRN